MRKYRLYAAGICTVLALGIGGCASNGASAATETRQESQEASKEETTEADTAADNVEDMNGQDALQSLRIYGPVTKQEDGRLSIDNQSDMSISGEIILNVSEEYTYILDAVTGLPLKEEDIKDGDTIYVYIGPAMTMSLPPMTNADVIFANIPADAKVPDYIEVQSLVTDAATSKSVLTAADGTEYTVESDCNIFPYLTRNIVTLDDLTQGRKCVVWSDEDNAALQIMVFAE
ncbi:hypothetical protein PM027_13580 [[Clostridium] symbiosum]|uniref:hypothetical protein n=1 Tax=Clostridium symbiosum TaxID=1512 RepID=UPI001A9B7F1F|nr:hypothetical protein [[Clostridium] symbiosum]MDB2019088.1 hypothetical protein [[Clostridium] symbiosum]